MITDTNKAAFDIILTFLFKEKIKLNEITRQFEQDGKPQSEQDINYHFISIKNDNPQSKGLTKQYFDLALNSSYIHTVNPLKDFFKDRKEMKQAGFIDKLIDSLNLIENAELERRQPGRGLTKSVVKTLFTKWLVGVIASIYDHNYNCLMIVLIGKKGCGKTEFFRRLLPAELKNYFAQSKFADGKDSEALMCEKLLLLNDELDGLHAREARTFRNFISADYYTYRPPYAKQNVTRKRLASVCGASNDRNIITDAENNRRIIPIEITGVDHTKYNNVDKTSLMMEAYNLYKAGYDWNLTTDEMLHLDALSETYETPSLEYELIQKYFIAADGQSEFTASEIKSHIENLTHQRLSLHKIGSTLKRLGFENKFIKRSGKSAQVYSCTMLQSTFYNSGATLQSTFNNPVNAFN